jgi:hypothetical protein
VSQIKVPAPRPYVPRHLASDPEPAPVPVPRPVGEGTRERRPYTLAEVDGPTRRIDVTSGFFGIARAVWRYGTGAR